MSIPRLFLILFLVCIFVFPIYHYHTCVSFLSPVSIDNSYIIILHSAVVMCYFA